MPNVLFDELDSFFPFFFFLNSAAKCRAIKMHDNSLVSFELECCEVRLNPQRNIHARGCWLRSECLS